MTSNTSSKTSSELQQFAAQLEQLEQKVNRSEVQQYREIIKLRKEFTEMKEDITQYSEIIKLRKEFTEMKEVILDAQREYYDDTRVILQDITQKLSAISSDKL